VRVYGSWLPVEQAKAMDALAASLQAAEPAANGGVARSQAPKDVPPLLPSDASPACPVGAAQSSQGEAAHANLPVAWARLPRPRRRATWFAKDGTIAVSGTYDRIDRLPEIRAVLTASSNYVEALFMGEEKRTGVVECSQASVGSR
jgi:hypothetical protein